MKRRGFLKALASVAVAAPTVGVGASGVVSEAVQGPLRTAILPIPCNPVAPALLEYGVALRDGFRELYGAEYRHMGYGYTAVMRGDSIKFEPMPRPAPRRMGF